jgi:hypothetical protein
MPFDPLIQTHQLLIINNVIYNLLNEISMSSEDGKYVSINKLREWADMRALLLNACKESLIGAKNHDSHLKTKVINIINDIYIPKDDDIPSIFDDVVDCMELLPQDAKKINARAALYLSMNKIRDAVKIIYDYTSATHCVAIFDMVGSQGFHTSEIDLIIKYIHRELSQMDVDMQKLRPGDDEIVAFFKDEKVAINLAVHCIDNLINRLKIVSDAVNFRCAIYTWTLHKVHGDLRGEAIVFAARLLQITEAGQIALSEPSREKLQKDFNEIENFVSALKDFKDKHQITHKYHLITHTKQLTTYLNTERETTSR